jgi:hypothetical protein
LGSSTSSGSNASGSSSGTSSLARGGNAVAVSNSVDATTVSNQVASANGGTSVTTNMMTQMLRNLPSGTWDPFVQQNLPDTAAPAIVAGMASSSGNSTAVGLSNTIGATNGQIAACQNPGQNCTAVNANTMSISMSDLANNPATQGNGSARGSGSRGSGDNGFGPGGTNASSGFAGVDATPTPPPTSGSHDNSDAGGGFDDGSGIGDGSGGVGGGGVRRNWNFFATNVVANQINVDGHIVLVDLFDQWPGRRLPPMPNPVKTSVASSTVDASLARFPDTDELPLPLPGAQNGDGSATATRRVSAASPTSGLRGSLGVSTDQSAGDDDLYPPLPIQDVDPWPAWPESEGLPIPVQVLPAAAVAAPQPAVAPDATAPLPPDNGAMPMPFDLAVFLSMLTVAVRVTMRYGRALFAVLRSWFNQRRRAMILLRLAASMLRLW